MTSSARRLDLPVGDRVALRVVAGLRRKPGPPRDRTGIEAVRARGIDVVGEAIAIRTVVPTGWPSTLSGGRNVVISRVLIVPAPSCDGSIPAASGENRRGAA